MEELDDEVARLILNECTLGGLLFMRLANKHLHTLAAEKLVPSRVEEFQKEIYKVLYQVRHRLDRCADIRACHDLLPCDLEEFWSRARHHLKCPVLSFLREPAIMRDVYQHTRIHVSKVRHLDWGGYPTQEHLRIIGGRLLIDGSARRLAFESELVISRVEEDDCEYSLQLSVSSHLSDLGPEGAGLRCIRLLHACWGYHNSSIRQYVEPDMEAPPQTWRALLLELGLEGTSAAAELVAFLLASSFNLRIARRTRNSVPLCDMSCIAEPALKELVDESKEDLALRMPVLAAALDLFP